MASHMLDFFITVQKASITAYRFDRVQKNLSRFWFFIQSQFSLDSRETGGEDERQDSESFNQQYSGDEKKGDSYLNREEIEFVMERLGLFCSPGSEELELSHIFDENEPSLEEVREAFEVFDQNRDGFIDAKELQRILCGLGFKEGFELQNCRKMIKPFDENEDGKLDFNDFVRLMENSFQ